MGGGGGGVGGGWEGGGERGEGVRESGFNTMTNNKNYYSSRSKSILKMFL